MSEENQTPDPAASQDAAVIGVAMRLARHPGATVALVFLAGPIATYVMTTYVAPAIHEGIEAHKIDPNAHPEQFERLDAIEKKMGDLEGRYNDDTTAMTLVLGEVSEALRER